MATCTDVETWQAVPRLVCHAIQMCSADDVYTEAENARVRRAARLMGVADDIALSFRALVDMERSVHDLCTSLLHGKGAPAGDYNGSVQVG